MSKIQLSISESEDSFSLYRNGGMLGGMWAPLWSLSVLGWGHTYLLCHLRLYSTLPLSVTLARVELCLSAESAALQQGA